MNTRVLNTYIVKVKLDMMRGQAWLDDFETLREILVDALMPSAIKAYGQQPGERFAYGAASIGLERIRMCRMFFYSWAGGRQLLQEAVKRSIVTAGDDLIASFVAAPKVSPHRGWVEPLLFYLRSLIHLSDRLWVYIELAAARDQAVGRKGRLAEIIYGPRRMQGRLAEPFDTLEQIDAELTRALAELIVMGPGQDPGLKCLAELKDEILAATPKWLDSGSRSARFQEAMTIIVRNVRAPSFGSPDYPRLADALAQVEHRLGAMPPAEVGDAATQFADLRDRPTAAGATPLTLVGVLDRLPAVPHAGDPGDILTALRAGAITPSPSAKKTAPDPVLPPDELRTLMLAQVDPTSPEFSALADLVLGDTLDHVRQNAAMSLPGPAKLTVGRVNRAIAILNDWQQRIGELVSLSRTSPARARYGGFSYLDIPNPLWRNPGQIDGTTAEMKGWVCNPGPPPAAWAAVSSAHQATAQAALAWVTLDELHENLKRIYEAKRGYE
jgi:hypothetical protein